MKNACKIFLALISLSFFSCQKWVSDGVVEMDKLISLDSVWENAEQYIGKRITLKLDSIPGSASGSTARIQGKSYNATRYIIPTDTAKYSNIENWLLRNNIDTMVEDTFYRGLYYLAIISDARMGDTLDVPHWIEYDGKILNFAKQYRKKNITYAVGSNIKMSPQKFISGYLMYRDTNYTNWLDTKITLMSRELVIAPTGYKYFEN